MLIKSLESAFYQHGPEGLTETGKQLRFKCITGIAAGTAFLVAALITIVLLRLDLLPSYSGLFPSAGPIFGAAYGSVLCILTGIALISLSTFLLHIKRSEEHINTDCVAKVDNPPTFKGHEID